MSSLQSLENEPPLKPHSQQDPILPALAPVGLLETEARDRMAKSTMANGTTNYSNIQSFSNGIAEGEQAMQLELKDGTKYRGISFGAKRSIAGELVFQTGMVGYPESITDPSYRGQILVITFPLVGNYGVPSRETMDGTVSGLPAHFEATQIHVSGLVVASYAGEDYSHHLATSSLGTWLKEQGIPAMYGVDTRALTKRIRERGSMLGRMVSESKESKAMLNGHTAYGETAYQPTFESIDWLDPNIKNLVADGELILRVNSVLRQALTALASLYARASSIHAIRENRSLPSQWASH